MYTAHILLVVSSTQLAIFRWLYLAEVNFIDGQALTPSSFGATDASNRRMAT
jgi:hypothetical protein